VKSTPKLSTAAAAKTLGVSKATLLRWFKQGKVDDVGRDRNGWRVFTSADVLRIRKQMGTAA
jgi:DNA-binding transcriptional MerR regulator